MSVASKNLFALLDEESQDISSPPVQKQDSSAEPAAPNKSSNQQRGRGPASRGGRYYQRGAKSATPAGQAENVEENGSSEPRKRREGDQRGRGRGGRGRGRGGGRGREFDRHSGTLPDSEKRVHQGWGGDDGERELKNEQEAVADAIAASGAGDTNWAAEPTTAEADWTETGAGDQQGDDWSAPPVAADTVATSENKEAAREPRRRRDQEDEEEDNTVTLDQYLAQKKQSSTELPKLEGIRKANEGSDESLWKNAVHNGKANEEEHYFVGKQHGKSGKAKAKKAEKEFIEIEARFERPSRGGRGRGRGGDERRGRGRGGNRNTGRNAGTTDVNVADESAFPSLS